MAECKGCGKRIIWGELYDQWGKPQKHPDGRPKVIPLDPAAPVYRVFKHDAAGTAQIRLVPLEEGQREVMVSHFKTCPKASDFSGSNR